MTTHYDYLIIGGGMTGAAAATALRETAPEASVGVIAKESHVPYNRPPLSKGLWKGEEEASVWRDVRTAGVELHEGRVATAVDVGGHKVRTDSGQEFGYGKLLLATGARARTLGTDSDRVIYFRTIDDYHMLRKLATAGSHVAVIGGGFIGCEVAAALRMNDVRVSMIVPEEGLGARVFPPELATFLADYYREHGAEVHTGVGAKSLSTDATGVAVQLGSGATLQADAVVAGLGVIPNVSLAEAAGLEVDNGIVVDARLQTSAPDIFAAGDVASYFSPQLNKRIRVEHEDNSNTMGAAVARSMAGENVEYRHLAFFYSDLFDLGYEAVGEIDSRLDTFVDWKVEYREGVIYYMKDARVRGVLLWNTWGQLDAARQLIENGAEHSHQSLEGLLR